MEFINVVPSGDSCLDAFLIESCYSFLNNWWEARWVQYSRRVGLTSLLGGPEATISSNNDLWTVVGEFLVRWVCTITKPLLTLTAKLWIDVSTVFFFWCVHVKPASSKDAVMQTCQCIFRELILWDLSWREWLESGCILNGTVLNYLPARVVLQQSEYCLLTFFSEGTLGFVSKVSVFQRFSTELLNFLTHFSLKEQKIKFQGRL